MGLERSATPSNWRVFIPPYRVGKPFQFVIDGIFDTDTVKYPATDLTAMYFQHKYLYEAIKPSRSVGTLTELIDDPRMPDASAKRLMRTLRTVTFKPRPEPRTAVSRRLHRHGGRVWRCCLTASDWRLPSPFCW